MNRTLQRTMAQVSQTLVVALGLLSSGIAQAAGVAAYGEAIEHALAANPSVVAAYHEFEAARQGQRAAEGDLYPTVDLNADVARESRETPLNDFGDYDRDSIRFSVSQLLFDGFQTRDLARAQGHLKLARYHDFHDVSQSIALDATVAYLQTVKFQMLVGYAEDNYVFHRQIFDKIAERVAAGRDEGVNLEQATARMALAESNLLTEVTNLYDTRTEFQRVVGEVPADELPMPSIPLRELPSMRTDALRLALINSPEIKRAAEEIKSAKERYGATRGPMYPRFDLRYRNEQETNTQGFRGDYDLQAIELVVTYNLYRGGGDSARRRESYHRYYSAIENHKQACLNVRRETSIAFNNLTVLEQQVLFLQQQLTAQDKTRRAYGDQFDRRKRTLLDLLDSQNEYFNTQRALVSAQTDLMSAQATVLAELGVLTDSLDANGFNADKMADVRDELASQTDDLVASCGADLVPAVDIDKDALFQRLNARAADTEGTETTEAAP